jgi:uncharacterized tellurite resistance protein B-like protein
MSFVDLYSNSEHRTNLAHFAAIATLAAVDGSINAPELAIIDRFAKKLGISQEEYKEVMKKENKYPIDPPSDAQTRLERLFDLSRMVYADHVLGPKQKDILTKFCLALGFTPGNVSYIVDKAFSLIMMNVDLDTFVYEMTHMNK